MSKERNNSRWKVKKKLVKLRVIQSQGKKKVRRKRRKKEKKYIKKETSEQEVKELNHKREIKESLLPKTIVSYQRDTLWQVLKSKLKSLRRKGN